jgi:H+/Cl- antiporter ClcA
MNNNNSNWINFLIAIEYFFGAFFLGITSILVIEELGDWFSRTLDNPPLWRWWLTGLITGAILIVIFRFIVKTASEMERPKQ